MCKVVEDNPQESVLTSLANQSVASVNLSKNLVPLETICEDINRILSPGQANPPAPEQITVNTQKQSQAEQIYVSGTRSPSTHQDDHNPASMVETEMTDMVTESEPQREGSKLTESDPDPAKEKTESPLNVQASTDPCPPHAEGTSLTDITGDDVEMEERKDGAASNGSTEKSEAGVIILDD